MNVQQALDQAQAQVIPEFLFGMGIDAVLEERRKNEEAIKALVTDFFEQDVPSFSFDVVRELALRNRELCDTLAGENIPQSNSLNLSRSLPESDLARAIAALQNRNQEEVAQELSDKRTNIPVVFAAAPLGGTVVGIDIETTDIAPDRGHIINIGWEFCSIEPQAQPYEGESLYCGLPHKYESIGVPLAEIHQITWEDLSGRPRFEDDDDLQCALLALMETYPYMAHNASFEDSWFMLNLKGYAEGRKAGRITVIDTRLICRELDPETKYLPHEQRPSSLESWARRRGTLGQDEAERHLGLDDTDLMLKTVIAEFTERSLF